jgi:hypothetical protein
MANLFKQFTNWVYVILPLILAGLVYYYTKNILYTAVTLAGTLLVSFIIRNRFDNSAEISATDELLQTNQDELQQLANKGVKPTISAVRAENLAAKLFEAMSGPGTDEDAIFAVIDELKNDADVLLVTKKFGKRAGWTFIDYSLPEWILSELSGGNVRAINERLKKKGISYRY